MSWNGAWVKKHKTKLDLRPIWNLQSFFRHQKAAIMPVSWNFYFKPSAVCLHPRPGAPGHSASGCWKCRHTSSRAMYPAKSTKSQSFLSTSPLAFPCTVMWNSSNYCLQNWKHKVKCHSADCVFVPQELLGHFRKQAAFTKEKWSI